MLSRVWRVIRYPSTCIAATFTTALSVGLYLYSRHDNATQCLEETYIDKHANEYNCTAMGESCHWGEKPHHGKFDFNCSSYSNEFNLLNNATAYADHILSPHEYNMLLIAILGGAFIGLMIVILVRASCISPKKDDEWVSDEYEPIVDDAAPGCFPCNRLRGRWPRFFVEPERQRMTHEVVAPARSPSPAHTG